MEALLPAARRTAAAWALEAMLAVLAVAAVAAAGVTDPAPTVAAVLRTFQVAAHAPNPQQASAMQVVQRALATAAPMAAAASVAVPGVAAVELTGVGVTAAHAHRDLRHARAFANRLKDLGAMSSPAETRVALPANTAMTVSSDRPSVSGARTIAAACVTSLVTAVTSAVSLGIASENSVRSPLSPRSHPALQEATNVSRSA